MHILFSTNKISRQSIKLGKLNLFYGHSGSGKTTLVQTLSDGFSAKSKHEFKVDGYAVSKSEFEVMYFDAKHDFANQIKLDSKSLLRRIIFDLINHEIEETILDGGSFVDSVNSCFQQMYEPINLIMKKISQISNRESLDFVFKLDSINDILASVFSIVLGTENQSVSSSHCKLLLFPLISEYIKLYPKRYIIIVDNFDAEIDEENSIALIQYLKENLSNQVTFILTSNKGTSLQYAFSRCKCFCVRHHSILDISKLFSLFQKSQVEAGNKERFSYEEYIINTPYIEIDKMESEFSLIKPYISYSIGRLVTSNECRITDIPEFSNDCVTIVANNKMELSFYRYIQHFISQ